MALTNAASVELEPIWATLLAKALEGKNVKDMLSNVGAGGGGPAVGSAPAAAGGAAAAEQAPKAEEKKEEEKEESDDDMVCFHITRQPSKSDHRYCSGFRSLRLMFFHCYLLLCISLHAIHSQKQHEALCVIYNKYFRVPNQLPAEHGTRRLPL